MRLDRNQCLKEVDELKRINYVVSAEMLEPNVGVFLGSVLSGFEAAWEEQRRLASASSIPQIFENYKKFS